jgi:hypothetical protein
VTTPAALPASGPPEDPFDGTEAEKMAGRWQYMTRRRRSPMQSNLPAELRRMYRFRAAHPDDGAFLAAADELERLQAVVDRAVLATKDACSCGGRGPGDDEACDACVIYHAMEVRP